MLCYLGPAHYFIDGKCHTKQLKSVKSNKTWLTKHTWSISHHITPLVINAFGDGHQHVNLNNFKKLGMPAAGWCILGLIMTLT